ncbi:sialic acid TRAP transporter permease protein SiaT [bacterium BMS3Abin04]|nr:sialic acid TRAP transporter permease protein SiaT [bacterium BMS3Abin04]
MNKVKRQLDNILSKIVIFIMAFMVINVLWQVFSRFVMKSPSSFTEELARYLLIWLGILGASYATGQKLHLAIDLLPTKLKGKKKLYLDIIIELCILIFSLSVMVIGGARLMLITFDLNQISAALQIPLGYVYVVIPLSGLIMSFYSLFFISKNIKQLKIIK